MADDEWRRPQHDDDASIGADDGTRWIYSPGLKIWNGYTPGDDGLWELGPEEMVEAYPEVVAYMVEHLAAETETLRAAVKRVREAWRDALEHDHLLPQGFGWPGPLYDALVALSGEE